MNSIPSANGAYKAYDADPDGRSVRKSDVGGTDAAHQPPHHAAERLDGYSLKSFSTMSQLSTVAEKYVSSHKRCTNFDLELAQTWTENTFCV